MRYITELSKENITNVSEAILYKYLNNKKIVFNQILEKLPIIYLKYSYKKLQFYIKKWKNNISIPQIVFKNISPIKINITELKNKSDDFICFNDINLSYRKDKRKSFLTNRKFCSSTPQKIKLNKKRLNEYNNYNKTNKHLNSNSFSIFNDFLKRQEIFLKQKNESKKQLYKDSEYENDLIYTFNPKINDNKEKLVTNNIPAHLRLYQDSERRKKRQEIRENLKKEENLKPFCDIEKKEIEKKNKYDNQYTYSPELKCFTKIKKKIMKKKNKIYNSYDYIQNDMNIKNEKKKNNENQLKNIKKNILDKKEKDLNYILNIIKKRKEGNKK